MNGIWRHTVVAAILAIVLVTGSLGAMQGKQIGLAVEPSIFGGDDAINAFLHLNDEWAMKPGFSYALTRVDGETTSSGFTLRTALDYYLTPDAEASPYFGVDVGLFERETFGPDTEAENQLLTFLAPRAGAHVVRPAVFFWIFSAISSINLTLSCVYICAGSPGARCVTGTNDRHIT